MEGREFAHYVLLERLGQGGMGVVYKARDTRLGRTVAIKVLPPRVSVDPERRGRFLREARTAAQLNHPNIATIYEVGQARSADAELTGEVPEAEVEVEVLYIAMEYVEGEDLHHRLQREPLSLAESLDIAVMVGEGLAAAHRAGVVHRDLKPGNIMVTPEGQAKLLDFGLAKSLREPAPAEAGISVLTVEGMVMGTPPYMAPEQLQGTPVDFRCDLFSFGAVLYQMVAGEPPFGGGKLIDFVKALAGQDPEPPSRHRPGVPPELDTVVLRLLAKEPEQRHPSARRAVEELRSVRRLLADADSITPTTVVPLPRLPPPARRRRWWIGAAALAALTLLAAILVPYGSRWYKAGGFYRQGVAAMEENRYQDAAFLFGRALDFRAGSARVRARLSQALCLLGDVDGARGAAEEARSRNPEEPVALVAMACVRRLAGDVEGSLSLLTSLRRQYPELDEIDWELALGHEQKGDLRQAEEHLLRAIEARPEYWRYWNQLIDVRLRQGQEAGAIEALERARELAPDNVSWTHENMAIPLMRQCRFEEALEVLEGISSEDRSANTYANLGAAHAFLGQLEEAEESYTKAVRLDPSNAEMRLNLAYILDLEGKSEDARVQYEEAARFSGEDPVDHLIRAVILAKSERCREAVSQARNLEVELSDAIKSATPYLALVYVTCDEQQEALESLRDSAALGYPRCLVAHEPGFESLRSVPGFQSLIAE